MEKALIIENDKDISNLIAIHLTDMNMEVDKTFDGKNGLMKALNNRYRFILLNLRLPLLDGFEICKRIDVRSYGELNRIGPVDNTVKYSNKGDSINIEIETKLPNTVEVFHSCSFTRNNF